MFVGPLPTVTRGPLRTPPHLHGKRSKAERRQWRQHHRSNGDQGHSVIAAPPLCV